MMILADSEKKKKGERGPRMGEVGLQTESEDG